MLLLVYPSPLGVGDVSSSSNNTPFLLEDTVTNQTQPFDVAGLSRADCSLLANLAGLQNALRAAGADYPLLDNALATLRAQPSTPPALALEGDIATARAVLFATPIGARKSKACAGLVDLLARPGNPSEVM